MIAYLENAVVIRRVLQEPLLFLPAQHRRTEVANVAQGSHVKTSELQDRKR